MGLITNDLKFLVDKIIEIDSYKSKMGNDADIVTMVRMRDKWPITC